MNKDYDLSPEDMQQIKLEKFAWTRRSQTGRSNDMSKALDEDGMSSRTLVEGEGPESMFDFSEARHARDKCMSCDKLPTIDVLWAEGIGHAWFCAKCYTTWEKEHPGEVDNTKKIEHGIARMKFSDRTSPKSLGETENSVEEACTIKEVPTRAAGLSDEEILGLNLRLKELWDLHFEGNDAKVVKGKGDLTRAQVVAGLETIREEMEKRGLSEVAEAGRRVQAKRVKQVKDIIQAWQKLRTELEDWLKWAEYMDGDWVEAPNVHGEPVRGEIMQELLGYYVTISGTRVFIQEKAQFASRDREWDADAAEKRIRAWADAEEAPNAKYGRAFLYHDTSVEGFGGYKLPYQDVVEGELRIVPRAIFAVAGVLAGARGGVRLPEEDKKAIRKKVEGFYVRMRKEFDDESLGKE